MRQREEGKWKMADGSHAPSRKLQATSLTPGLDGFREAVALVLSTLAGHSEPLARDAAALSGMAGDVMGNRHAVPERKRDVEGRFA